MKKNLFTLLLCGLTLIAKAQNASVEKSIFGIQTGLVGVWGHNEFKLSNQIALRSEIGFDAGLWGGSFYPKTGYSATPVLRVEPRWYYNLNKRLSKSKSIKDNSANFLTIQTNYHPNWFVISNYKNVEVADQISIVPTWGIKRNIGKYLNYETGFGVGYRYIFGKSAGYSKNVGEIAVNLHLRIGFRL